jgi:hypothetical protein
MTMNRVTTGGIREEHLGRLPGHDTAGWNLNHPQTYRPASPMATVRQEPCAARVDVDDAEGGALALSTSA